MTTLEQRLAATLAEHRLGWDDDLHEWVCGETGAVCGWHRRVPREWRDEPAIAHAAHLAAHLGAGDARGPQNGSEGFNDGSDA